jgi:hypothetical protein
MNYKETILYHHLKTYIKPLNETQVSLILLRLPFDNVEYVIYFDGDVQCEGKRFWNSKIEL